MYQPLISDSLIHRVWAIAKAQNRPMTRVVADAVERHLSEAEDTIDVAREDEPAFAVTERGKTYLRRAGRAA